MCGVNYQHDNLLLYDWFKLEPSLTLINRPQQILVKKLLPVTDYRTGLLIISVYLSSIPVAYLSDASRRRLVVTGDSARIQDETTESSAWFFNVLGV